MNCVKCDGMLAKRMVGGIEVDKCAKCSGVWFDFGELEDALEEEDVTALRNVVDNNAGHDARRGHCPRCGGEGNMVQVADLEHDGVHVDTCTVCYGQWLDGGEFTRLDDEGLLHEVATFFRNLLPGV